MVCVIKMCGGLPVQKMSLFIVYAMYSKQLVTLKNIWSKRTKITLFGEVLQCIICNYEVKSGPASPV